MRKLLLLAAAVWLCAPIYAQVVWTKQPGMPSPPYWNQWQNMLYDPLNGVTFMYPTMLGSSAIDIYSSSLWSYNSSTHVLTKRGDNGQQNSTGSCAGTNHNPPIVDDTATWPGTRHPVGQMFMDTRRNRIILVEGTACTVVYMDMYSFQITNPLTTGMLWTKLNPAHNMAAQYGGQNLASCIYDSDDDAYFCFGTVAGGGSNGNNNIYCPTDLNTPPGTLTAAQSAVGCAIADDWNFIGGGIGAPLANQPNTNQVSMPGFVYDSVNHVGILYGGTNGSGTVFGNNTYAYNFPQKTWTNMNPGTSPPTQLAPYGTYDGLPSVAFDASAGVMRYHFNGNTSSATPGGAGTVPPADWTYNFATNTWTQLCNCGGPLTAQSMAYDAGQNKLVARAYFLPANGFQYEIWEGAIGGNVAPTITSSSPLPGGVQGTAYSTTITATGTSPITFTVTAGSLPAGLSLSSAGAITGTPTAAGTSTFTIQAANGTSPNATKQFSLTVTGPSFSKTITVQEALYPGSTSGVARTNEPFCMGFPFADASGFSNVSTFGISGATAGQFRTLGTWASGNFKWVETCGIVASVSAGSSVQLTVNNGGAGNFGGSNLATDPGGASPITVNTGAATFTIKKANFNGIDQVVVGGTTVVASNTSQGFVLLGPSPTATYPANVTCLPTGGGTDCANSPTLYMTSNDTGSTSVIESNGPVHAVIKSIADLSDGAGHIYMHVTVRQHFWQGLARVKVVVSLRNADLGTSGTFASAFKGHQGFELRLTPNITNTLNTYTVANHTGTPTSGTMTGSDSVYLYQGNSNSLLASGPASCAGANCIPYTTDTGYKIVKNGSTLLTGTNAQYPQGWADIQNASGVGIEIGAYQLAALGPKSLEFNAGGTDLRIGIWPRENSQPYYTPWPQSQTHDLFLNFHATAPASLANEFLKFQHPLIARACAADANSKCHDLSYYNSTKVFPYTLIDPDTEDAYLNNMAATASPVISSANSCCLADFTPQMIRFWTWGATGGPNQTEFRWSYLLNFITRGFTGRYLQASHWYRYAGDSAWPKSDGFTWRSQASTQLDHYDFPNPTSANSTLASRYWISQDTGEHAHWYGMGDYYMMTGDESIKDAILDGPKEWYLSPNTAQFYPHYFMFNARGIGANLMGAARYSAFLASIGDPDAAAVLQTATDDYSVQVNQPLCTITGGVHYPAGCTMGPIDAFGGPQNWNTTGVNPIRGVFATATAATGTPWCNNNHNLRVNKSFMDGILEQGLMEYANALGSSNPGYLTARDLAYGIAQNVLTEVYKDDGTGQWGSGSPVSMKNGFRYDAPPDWANNCTGVGESPVPADYNLLLNQTVWMNLFAKHATDGGVEWKTKFNMAMSGLISADGYNNSSPADDLGSPQVVSVINILNAGDPILNNVPITNFTDLTNGSYTIQWTVPANTSSYRIKYGTVPLVDVVGFDSGNNVYTGDPVNTMPWFAATNVTPLPAPLSAGSTQTLTIATGLFNLVKADFSVKAYVSQSALTVTAQPLSPTTVGAAFSQSVASWATGGTTPYSAWSIATGGLPVGLTLAGSTGLISGTVGNTTGTFNFTVSVTDATAATATSSTASIVVNAAPVITTSSPLPGGTVGTAYSQTLTATGGTSPLVWTISAGTLPSGLSLGSTTGQISGTPVTAGTANFTVQVTDANGVVATKALAIVVAAGCTIPIITTSSPLPTGKQGSLYSLQFTASGDPTITYSATGVPAGLSLSSSGLLNGTPTGTGTATLQVTATNSCGTQAGAPIAFSLLINPAGAGTTISGTVCSGCSGR